MRLVEDFVFFGDGGVERGESMLECRFGDGLLLTDGEEGGVEVFCMCFGKSRRMRREDVVGAWSSVFCLSRARDGRRSIGCSR